MKNYLNKRNLSLVLVLVLVLSFGLSGCDLFDSAPMKKTEEPSAAPEKTEESKENAESSESSEASESEKAAESKVAQDADQDFVGTLESLPAEENAEKAEGEALPILRAVDFSLRDQNGNRHKLEDYKGKVIILNFWQTWCPPCRAEMPDFQKVYENYGENKEDVIILGVASPKNELNTMYTQEQETDEGIAKFLSDNDYSYPNLMDYTAELYFQYEVQSFPTTIVIDKEGNLFGYQPGMLREEQLVQVIDTVLAK